ncbi:MAG: hypothetical protein IKW99_03375 [Bacteroidales bacterium]|nr:hypothetical protein [Bacteroidales bacterium]
MIKQIQLRGISRNPSDRMTADGGCAESLNVFLDNDETAPALKPVVVNTMTDDRGVAMFPNPDWGHNWEAVFIHKTPMFERAIIKYTDEGVLKLGTWGVRAVPDWIETGCTAFLSLGESETFIRCVNLGNTLGIVTSEGTKWALMKDGVYQALGSSIPFPRFTLANYDVEASDVSGEEVVREITRSGYTSEVGHDSYQPKAGFDENHLKVTWEDIDIAMAKNAKQGVYNKQQFAIFAVRLFDGTRIVSTPVLLAPGIENPFSVSYVWQYAAPIPGEEWTVTFNLAYNIFARLDEDANFFDDWEDIVDSIEIYLSEQIEPDRTKSEFGDYEITLNESDEATLVEGDLVLGEGKGSMLTKYLNVSNFYRVYSVPINDDNISTLRTGLILDTKDYMSTDNLVTSGIRLDTLSDMKHYDVRFDRATLYNNKIVASGISEKVGMSLNVPIAKGYWNPSLTDYPIPEHSYEYTNGEVLAFRMTFHLRDSAGRSFTIKARNGDSDYFTFGNETIESTGLKSNGYGMIFCPDARAFAVDVQAFYGALDSIEAGSVTAVGGATLSMTPHPNLDCSYWYGDMTSEMVSHCSQNATYIAGEESYVDNKPNKVYMSEMDNPFVFPVSSRYTLNSRVLGCAIATAALSEGQFGQFPIYVFTEDGIWAMESASDGTIVSTKPMSREVCSNPDSITPIDNAVVFMTEKTVMLVSGSQITDLSPFMNGSHYKMDVSSREGELIAGGDWREYISTLTDTTHFMAFMDKAEIAYDYKGGRLVFVNPDKTFQYVYILKTNTWHKLFVDGYGSDGPRLSNILNAYPDTYINAGPRNRYIWNLSSKLDVTSSTSIKGVIVTRPFDLGSPDIRKVINDIRIRGRFNRRDVRYILMGSMDGINWGVLPSLHGGSYKWFRLILLTSLSPVERVSWIDIEYDTRMQNKLR